MRAVSVYSNLSEAPSIESLTVDNINVPVEAKPVSPVLTGYPGQFESYEVGYLRRRGKAPLITSHAISYHSHV